MGVNSSSLDLSELITSSNTNIEEIREYCLAKPAVTEGFHFDETILVFKVMKKVIMELYYTAGMSLMGIITT